MSYELSTLNDAKPALSSGLVERVHTKFGERWQTTWGGKSIFRARSPTPHSVRLDGNDYLSLTGHKDIINAQLNSLSNASQEVVQSAIFAQEEDPSRQFESALASMVGKTEAVLCQSGYMANIGVLQAIATPETPVYIDGLAHASLWEGIHAARAQHVLFRHNDPEHLNKMVAMNGPGIIVVDSVYSTTGAMCPLLAIVEVCERHGCMIIVDESHSLGTHGPQGRGVCVDLGLSDRVHFITASLAKSFAGRAGFYTISSGFRPYCLSKSFPNIFSSGLLPYEIAGLAATLPLVLAADDKRERLMAKTLRLRKSLTELGYPIHQGTEQIIALEAGPEGDTLILRQAMEEQDVFGAVFCAPATSKNRSMVRCTLNSELSEQHLCTIERAAQAILPIVKPQEWPIARRAGIKAGA